MSSWACKKCTFLNSPSRKSTCQICLTPSSSFSPPSKSSVSVPTWSCKACTFLNPYNNTSCELCNTRAPVSGLSSFEDLTDPALDSELDSSVGSVFLPLQLKACTGKRKIRDQDCDGDFDGFRVTNSVSIKGQFFFFFLLINIGFPLLVLWVCLGFMHSLDFFVVIYAYCSVQ